MSALTMAAAINITGAVDTCHLRRAGPERGGGERGGDREVAHPDGQRERRVEAVAERALGDPRDRGRERQERDADQERRAERGRPGRGQRTEDEQQQDERRAQ